jgi:hypothetical protein
MIGRPHVAITTIAATIDMSMVMTVSMMTDGVMSSSRRTAATSATYLLHR